MIFEAMKRELVIDHSLGVTRAAVVEDGKLCELHIERDRDIKQTGSLYLGKIQAIRPSVRAAFIDVGLGQNAFLPVRPDEGVRCGEWMIVQGEASQPTAQKGLRVTRNVSLPGRLLVINLRDSGVRVSKKIADLSKRQALAAMGEAICPQECGLILRTAAQDATREELENEVRKLLTLWQKIQDKAAGMTVPGHLRSPAPLAVRLACELASRGLARVVVNDLRDYDALAGERSAGALSPATALECFDEQAKGILLFDALAIESQAEKALDRRVWLPCGGYLVIDRCEAMTVIDVNSGKMTKGCDLEENAVRVNWEAAEEIARQLRLRNTGGIIVADFIDMRKAEHREELVKRMREAVSTDREGVTVEGMTRLGLMELTRRRRDEELGCVLREPCLRCGAAEGQPVADEVARQALRSVRRLALCGQRGPFCIRCGAACAQALARLPRLAGVSIYVLAIYDRRSVRFDIEQLNGASTPPAGAILLSESLPEKE